MLFFPVLLQPVKSTTNVHFECLHSLSLTNCAHPTVLIRTAELFASNSERNHAKKTSLGSKLWTKSSIFYCGMQHLLIRYDRPPPRVIGAFKVCYGADTITFNFRARVSCWIRTALFSCWLIAIAARPHNISRCTISSSTATRMTTPFQIPLSDLRTEKHSRCTIIVSISEVTLGVVTPGACKSHRCETNKLLK